MKKVLFFLSVVLVLFVTGCKSAPAPEPAPAPAPVKEEPKPVVKEEPKPPVVEKPAEPPKEDPAKFLNGEWLDPNWNAKWIISGSAAQIKDYTTGESIHLFTKGKMSDESDELTDDTRVWSFYCAETNRKYRLTGYNSKMKKNVLLQIDPDWTEENYSVELEKLN